MRVPAIVALLCTLSLSSCRLFDSDSTTTNSQETGGDSVLSAWGDSCTADPVFEGAPAFAPEPLPLQVFPKPIAYSTDAGLRQMVGTTPDGLLLITRNSDRASGGHPVGNIDDFNYSQWKVSVFRPQNAARDAQTGILQFDQDTLSPPFLLKDYPTRNENWRPFSATFYPDPQFSASPYRSDLNGNEDPNGAYHTYALVVIAQMHRMHRMNGDPALFNTSACSNAPGAPCRLDPALGFGLERLSMNHAKIVIADYGKPSARVQRTSLPSNGWTFMAIDENALPPLVEPPAPANCTLQSELNGRDLRHESVWPPVGKPYCQCNSDPECRKYLSGKNPSVTVDGRLMFFERGTLSQPGVDISYVYNPSPKQELNWTAPKFASSLCSEPAWFRKRYPIAEKCFTRFTLRNFGTSSEGIVKELVTPGTRIGLGGAYPWISPDGDTLFYTAGLLTNDQTGPNAQDANVRSGQAVVGKLTNWTVQHIDGPLNHGPLVRVGERDAAGALEAKTTHFGPGATPGMWSPYRNVSADLLPVLPRSLLFPFFYASHYYEVSLEESRPGAYLAYFPMNEAIAKVPNINASASAQTHFDDVSFNHTLGVSHHHSIGLLRNGATFPFKRGNRRTVGAIGQAIYFEESGFVRVPTTAQFELELPRISFQFWVYLEQEPTDKEWFIVRKPEQFNVLLSPGRTVRTTLETTAGTRQGLSSTQALQKNRWNHVSIVYDGSSIATYINAVPAGRTPFGAAAPVSAATSDLFIGPNRGGTPSGNYVLRLDEVGISGRALSAQDIRNGALVWQPKQKLPERRLLLPPGLEGLGVNKGEERLNTSLVRLGEALFFEPLLSKDRNISCASCHEAGRNFTDGLAISVGINSLTRNAQPLFNRLGTDVQFWDGRANSLEAQARHPIVSADEMGMTMSEVVSRLNASTKYRNEFCRAFGTAPTEEGVLRALAAFQRTILNGNSRVDRYESGELSALDASEIRGRNLFNGKARCIACHHGPNYTDEKFHNTALNLESPFRDAGRFLVTGRMADVRAFKTPSLRGLASTGPYLHDGSAQTLLEVVQLYNKGGEADASFVAPELPSFRSPEIVPLGLSVDEENDLVAFLVALNGETTWGLQNLTAFQGEKIWSEVLERSPPESALEAFFGFLASGRSLEEYRSNIASSEEARLRIGQAWTQILNRSPDATGISYAVNYLNGGKSLADYRRWLATSAEARDRFILPLIREVFGPGSAEFLISQTVIQNLGHGLSYAAIEGLLRRIHAADHPLTLQTNFSALSSKHASCSIAEAAGSSCRAAAHRLCRDIGYEGGVGPLEFSSRGATIACLPSQMAQLRSFPYASLAARHAECNAPGKVLTLACRAAVSRACAATGLLSGYGIVEVGAGDVAALCAKASTFQSVVHASIDKLQALHSHCGSSLESGPCLAAWSRMCANQGASTGYGPIEANGAQAMGMCLHEAP